MSEKEAVIERIVEESGLAMNMKSGSLPVLATPQMIAWMEEASCAVLAPDEGQTSVGILMNVTHDAPSPLGAKIEIRSRLTGEKGRILTFEVSAWMKDICIGKGTHKRALVQSERFLSKIYPGE